MNSSYYSMEKDVDNTEVVSQLRTGLGAELNATLDDDDCLRFLLASKSDIQLTSKMVNEWWTWRNSALPGTHAVTPANILAWGIDMENRTDEYFAKYAPIFLGGEDKEGRPIYWGKSGVTSTNSSEIKKFVSADEFVASHVLDQEYLTARRAYLSQKHSKKISQVFVIFDNKSLSMMPSSYIFGVLRRIVFIDDRYYPERLFKTVLINSPWFFTAVWAIVKPWLDEKTAKKVEILGNDYIGRLRELIDDSEIPEEYGGTLREVRWEKPYSESSGCSPAQIREYMKANYKSASNASEKAVPVDSPTAIEDLSPVNGADESKS